MSLTSLLLGIGLLTLWLLAGVGRAIRDALSARFAHWLLPEGQPATVRIAQAVARLASWIYPSRYVRFFVREGLDTNSRAQWAHVFWPPVTIPAIRWSAPSAAIAEIAADLDCSRRVIAPVRLTLPLLWIASLHRLFNIAQRGLFGIWTLIAALCIPVAVMGACLSTLVAVTRAQTRTPIHHFASRLPLEVAGIASMIWILCTYPLWNYLPHRQWMWGSHYPGRV